MIGTTPFVTPQSYIGHPMVPPVVTPPTLWPKKFPSIISALFSFFQAVVTIVIIGCEIGSILVDAVTATIYVGLWAGLFFLFAWISQSVSCEFSFFRFQIEFQRVFFFLRFSQRVVVENGAMRFTHWLCSVLR